MPLMRQFRRPAIRIATALTLSAVMAVLLGALVQRHWSATSADADLVRAERRGVAYLQPLSRLLGTLTEAQSAAVRGAAVDAAAVRASVAEVDAADRADGEALRTRQRWSELRDRIEAVLTGPARGAAAYAAYTETTTLAIALFRTVGDSSTLILDPELDSYYLMDTALIRLPDLVLHAGRAADLAALAGDRTPAGSTALALAVARNRVATSAEESVTGLRKSIETSDRSALGTNITAQLDQFQAAVDRFVPPTVISQLAVPVQTATLPEEAGAVRSAAATLGAAVLTELDAVLQLRLDRLDRTQVLTATAAAIALIAGILLLLLLVSARRAPDDADPGHDPGSPDAFEEEPAPDLVDARDLLIEELIHVGRAVKPRGRGRTDDAV